MKKYLPAGEVPTGYVDSDGIEEALSPDNSNVVACFHKEDGRIAILNKDSSQYNITVINGEVVASKYNARGLIRNYATDWNFVVYNDMTEFFKESMHIF